MANKILLIVIDQLRADCLAGSLADAVPLPHLQALMREATHFRQHYTVTTPCGPSRASLLTGLYAMNHRSVRNGTPLAKHHLTIGHHMRKSGYEPMLFGYTDVSADPTGLHANDPDLKSMEGLAPGFAEIVRMRMYSPGSWVGYLKARGYPVPGADWDLYKPVLDTNTASVQFPDGSPIRSQALYSSNDSDTAYLTDRTIEELYVRESSDWFAMLTYIRPHPPFVAPAPYNTMFSPESLPSPLRAGSLEELKSSHPFFNSYFGAPSNHKIYHGFNGDLINLSELQIAEIRSVYLGLAFEVDHHIGRMIDYLKASNQYDDTLIIVTADHGEMLGDQWLWGKNTPLDAALRIPLIIRDPRQPQSFGQHISAITESIDIAPTLVDWIDLDSDKKTYGSFDGTSLLPLLSGDTPENWRKHAFMEAELGQPDEATHFQTEFGLLSSQANYAVLRTEHAKYVHFNGGLPPLFFDLKSDPLEHRNIANSPESNDVITQFSSMMLDHRMTYAHHALSNFHLTSKGLFTGN